MKRESRLVCILGGEAKWYRELINALGYELLHDNGQSHKRIVDRLKRSEILMMNVDCVSHMATLECKRVAKKYGVPVHTFAGSKMDLVRGIEKESLNKIKGSEKRLQTSKFKMLSTKSKSILN